MSTVTVVSDASHKVVAREFTQSGKRLVLSKDEGRPWARKREVKARMDVMVWRTRRVPESQKIRILIVLTGFVKLHFDDAKRVLRLTQMSRVVAVVHHSPQICSKLCLRDLRATNHRLYLSCGSLGN